MIEKVYRDGDGVVQNIGEWDECIPMEDGKPIGKAKNPLPKGLTVSEEKIIENDNGRFVASDYGRLRAHAYPSVKDQLDMVYHDQKNGTTTLVDTLEAVKKKYPKSG